MFIPKEIIQNGLMGFGWVAKAARRYHSTGINADPVEARKAYECYVRFSPVDGKDILEIGPGHTLEVLEYALAHGARSCAAADVAEYVSEERVRRSGITYRLYQGQELPYDSEQFDLVWSYNTFEHLRYPEVTAAECHRVLRKGGLFVAQIDLGDHSSYHLSYGPRDPSKLFECLKYPRWLWNIMRWNRSSYVNRLRKSEWLQLFQQKSFRVQYLEGRESEEIGCLLSNLPYLHAYSREDAVTYAIIVCAGKT
jgi:SAM-dependent methyltransferase